MRGARDPSAAIEESAAAARAALGIEPRAAVVLGSGLGAFADSLGNARGIETAALPHFRPSTVAGHAGRLVAGYVDEVPVAVLQGRVHGYEGYELADVTHGVRVLAALGARGIILTNAAGSLSIDLQPGSLMLIRDHVDLSFMPSVQAGSARGAVYSHRLAARAREAARALGIPLCEGCLVYGRGPSYETAAEVRVYRAVGGDAACMSTVPEAIAALDSGMEVMAISCISNLGTGLSPRKLTHDEVTQASGRAAPMFRALLAEIVRRAFPGS